MMALQSYINILLSGTITGERVKLYLGHNEYLTDSQKVEFSADRALPSTALAEDSLADHRKFDRLALAWHEDFLLKIYL